MEQLNLAPSHPIGLVQMISVFIKIEPRDAGTGKWIPHYWGYCGRLLNHHENVMGTLY